MLNRRSLLHLLGISPLALLAAKIPSDNPIIKILVKRWIQSKKYCLAVFEAMPEDKLEYAPTIDQMSFVQHFMHLSLINNFYMGILVDSKTYPDFDALIQAEFLIERPDPINLFQPDRLQKRDPKINKTLATAYISNTFDMFISNLSYLNDGVLTHGAQKEKPGFLSGHSNLDLILRGENHTAHHRAQAIIYSRLNGIRPPKYTPYNKF